MLVATALFLLLMILVPVFKSDELVDPGEDYVADTTGKKKSKLAVVAISQPLPLPLWNNKQILLYIGLYSGLTNQRITFLNGAFFARMTGMKLVLPQWKFDFSDYIGGTLFPFDYVLEFEPERLRKTLGVATEQALPMEYVNECMSQLMYTHGRASYGVASTTTYMSIDAALLIAKKRGILCLDADMSFYHLPKWNEKLRVAIKKPISLHGKRKFFREFWKQFHPSARYTETVDLILSRAKTVYKTYMSNEGLSMPFKSNKELLYISIHARLEDDMMDFCRSGRLKLTHHFKCENGHQYVCEATAGAIQDRLILDNVPENSLLFIVSGLASVTKALKGLCKIMLDNNAVKLEETQETSAVKGTTGRYICIRKESVWKPAETPELADIFNSLAFVDFIIASRSIAFYGHRYSSFSQHLVHQELHSRNVSAAYYNQRISC